MDPRILELVDRKIEQMRHFNDITSRIIYEDIDGVEELIERRQEIVTAVDGISADMRSLINQQSIDRRNEIKRLLSFEEISGLTGSMLELSERIQELKSVTETAMETEQRAMAHLEGRRRQIYEELTDSAKGKKVVNYFGATAVDVNKGSHLNSSH
ncbi:MAG: hypothetical protein K2N72_07340 [Oscillospiraceae bacterium]|nr:hypothetical protein [Oscillospiraceae bacterium]